MDVVPAVASEWKVPPFSGEVKDGYVWGRGALDDKGPGVIGLMSMLAIKRAGILLNRDIIFVATGDEEEGGKMGAGWFTEHEKDIFSDAGYLVTEGGGIQELPDGKKLYKVAVTEKTPLWIRLTSTGTEGHAAAPASDTSVTRLIRALSKVIDYQPRIRVIGPVQDEFHTIAELEHGPPQWLDLASSLRDLTFARKFLEDPSQNAKVRDTIAPTVLQGSDKTNIIPADGVCGNRLPPVARRRSEAVPRQHQKGDQRRFDKNRSAAGLSADTVVALEIDPDERDRGTRAQV